MPFQKTASLWRCATLCHGMQSSYCRPSFGCNFLFFAFDIIIIHLLVGVLFCVPFDIWLNGANLEREEKTWAFLVCVLSLCCRYKWRLFFCWIIFSCVSVRSHNIWIDAIEMNRFFIGFFHVNAFFDSSFDPKHTLNNWHTIWIDAFETVHARRFLLHFHRLTSISDLQWIQFNPRLLFLLRCFCYWLISVELKSLISLFFSHEALRCEVIWPFIKILFHFMCASFFAINS